MNTHIKITLLEFLKESENIDYKEDALSFIKNYLNITSNIVLKNVASKFNKDSLSQINANVGFSDSDIYTININFNDTKFGFVRRLAHELVHVKQMESGRLRKIDDNKISFDDIVYTSKEYDEMYHSDEMLPFEEEAFDKERVIANAYWNK